MRIHHHPVFRPLQRKEINFTFNGQTYKGLEGEPIAAALLANNIRTLRVHEESGTPRGIYCNIGHCYECRVTVNGIQGKRACLTPLTHHMDINSGEILSTAVRDWRKQHDHSL